MTQCYKIQLDLNNSMIQGDYLQNNPNFDAVMNTAGRKATD